MSPETYKRHRLILGTQKRAAELLGVTRLTILRREAGRLPITREAALAIERLTTTVRARGPRNH